MQVTVKFFASLRERMGKAEEQVVLNGRTTVSELWSSLRKQLDGDSPELDPSAVRAAVNHDYVDDDFELHDGDEVAFFPPVTGG
ncbi:MAG: molybdopterin converting factor subunit 1 [Pseudomonadota bacterium]